MSNIPESKHYPVNCHFDDLQYADWKEAGFTYDPEVLERQYPAKSYIFTALSTVDTSVINHPYTNQGLPIIHEESLLMMQPNQFKFYGYGDYYNVYPVEITNCCIKFTGVQPGPGSVINLTNTGFYNNEFIMIMREGLVESCEVFVVTVKNNYKFSPIYDAVKFGNATILKSFVWNFREPETVSIPDCILYPGYSLCVVYRMFGKIGMLNFWQERIPYMKDEYSFGEGEFIEFIASINATVEILVSEIEEIQNIPQLPMDEEN